LLNQPISLSLSLFTVHSVSQWPNLRHLGESLGGAEGLLEANEEVHSMHTFDN